MASNVTELRQLRYFVSIARLEHFGKASAELNVVQPALTRQIKQLEDELGVELFERLPRGVRLTACGLIFLERAERVISELDRAIAAVKNAAKGVTGSLRIGFADGATYSGHMPTIIRTIRESAPEIDMELIPASSLEQGKMLEESTIDAGFVYWLPHSPEKYEHRVLSVEKVVVAISNSNALSKRKSVNLGALQDLPVVWIKRAYAPNFYDMVVSECTNAGVTLNVTQEVFTESAMLSLVAAGIGLTFITEAAGGRKPDNVTLLPISGFQSKLELKAMWRKNNDNPALINFKATVETVQREA